MTDDTDSAATTDEQHGDTLPDSVREGLRDAMTSLERTAPAAGDGEPATDSEPATDVADLAPVGERLASAEVVGLGESTHGTREFFELKHRLLRYLVVEHGVRTFALESNLPETMALHDYVVHGEGDPREILAGPVLETWGVESVLSMVHWLREFNADRPLDDRVRVYGFGTHYSHGAVERLRYYLDAVDPEFLDAVRDDLTAVDDELVPPNDVRDVRERVEAAERLVPRLRASLDEHREDHTAATSERAWSRARRYGAVIEHVVDKTAALDAIDGDVTEDAEEFTDELLALPGRAMADNVAWIRRHTDADTLVLWAHDAHLNRVSYTGPDTDAVAPSLGRRLADRHGEGYFAVGFSLGRGTFRAIRENDDGVFEPGAVHLDGPVPGTLDAVLDGLDEPVAFVDLRAASEDERTSGWLAEPRGQFRTGGTYDPADPAQHLAEYVYADAFDGLCFVGETTRARSIDSADAPDSGQNEVHTDGETTDDASERA